MACKEKSNGVLEVLSYCQLKGISVKNGFKVLLKEAEKETRATQVQYWLDLRYEDDKFLKEIGFCEKSFKIGWKWTNGKKALPPNEFKANRDSRKLTATEFAKEAGFSRIYDAGQVKLIKDSV